MSKSQTDNPKQKSRTDWGLNEPSQRSGGQTRIALMMIVTLLGALGYFVYRKYDERGGALVQAADFTHPQEQESESSSPEEFNGSPPAIGAFDQPGPLDAQRAVLSSIDGRPVAPGPELDLPVQQGEPHVLDWFARNGAETEQNMPAPDTAPAQDLSLDWPIEPQNDPAGQPVDGEEARELFAAQEETTTSATSGPFESTATDRPETASPDSVNPFLMTADAATPVDDQAASETAILDVSPQAVDSAVSDAREAGTLTEPAMAPLTISEEETAAPWQDEPEVIRVNSDEQLGETTQQAAAFDNPFFPEDDTDIPEPPPSLETPLTTEQPATLDFGFPEPESPSVDPPPSFDQTASPGSSPAVDETPSIDWPSPAAESLPADVPTRAASASTGFGAPSAMGSTGSNDPFAIATTTAPPATRFDDAVQVHTVRQGDSYWSIARRHYGAGRYFSALAAYNQPRIADPNHLQLGMKVMIPEADVLQQRYPALLGGSYVPGRSEPLPAGFYMSRDGQPMYRVGRHDTLSSIAEAHLGRASRWSQIYGLNHDRLQNADRLQLGLELRLPADASQAELVSQPAAFR